MLHRDAIACLRSLEEQFPVAGWKVGALHVWPLIRCRLAQRLLAHGRPPAERTVDLLGSVQQAIAAAAEPLQAGLSPAGPADAVILTRPANRQLLDGRWFDRLFDPLSDIFEDGGWATLHLEHRADGTAYRLPRYRPAFLTRPAITRRNVAAALRTLRGARLDGYDRFARTVEASGPGLTAPSPIWIARRARSVEGVASYFEEILRRTSARLALCSVYYTLVGMAFCVAARRLGIPAVDVQHGVTMGNPAYDGWSRFPHEGYDVLPAWFWSWSDADAEPVARWPEHARAWHRAVAGGHPWMAFFTTDHPLTLAARRALPARPARALTILVTLTWSSGFSDALKRLVATAPAGWHWWIRLHPLMERERARVRAWCDAHAPGRASVDGPSDAPLPLLLSQADVHLTHNSSVVQEAARMGLPSVVIDRQALDVYPELCTGWAVFAGEPEAAIEALASRPLAAASLAPLSAYPSWSTVTSALRLLMSLAPSCPPTASAASFPIRVRA